jgi:hypothetical protein
MPHGELMHVVVDAAFGICGDLEVGAQPLDFHEFAGRDERQQRRL